MNELKPWERSTLLMGNGRIFNADDKRKLKEEVGVEVTGEGFRSVLENVVSNQVGSGALT